MHVIRYFTVTSVAFCYCHVVAPSSNAAVDARPNLHVNINLQINARDPAVPETPPPSYAVIARQISYISTISQTSSQRKLLQEI